MADETLAQCVPRYFAFLSYSHADRHWADWLYRSLETYRVPSRLVGQLTKTGVVPRRLIPIFRDREEFACATDLSSNIHAALAQSANLIVICSPGAAASRWVNEEVATFQRLGRSERIFCLVVDGEPNTRNLPGSEAKECFAPALHRVPATGRDASGNGFEPIAADVRPGKDGKTNAKLKLVAGMLGVGFDTLKQRELQRRIRHMAAIAAISLVVMLATTLLAIAALIARNAAEVARQSAERRQRQAEDLVGFMLGDLNDKLAQASRLDLMETVDDKAMAYFQSLPGSDVTDAGLLQRAKALEKIGVVRQEQGHLAAAMESFDAAARLAGSLADSTPGDPVRQLAYSRVLAFVGMTHWSQGKLDAAQQSFETAQRVLERAQPHEQDVQGLLFQSSMIANNIGHVLEARGRITEAEVQYRNMLARCEQLVAVKNPRTRWMSQLGSAHNNLGKMALLRGDLLDAVVEYAADDRIETTLSERDPGNVNQRGNMMRARAILGRTIALTGMLDQGIQYLHAAVDVSAQLLKIDPNQTEFQEYNALYSSQLSQLHRLRGDMPLAKTFNDRALTIFAQLHKQDAVNAIWQQEYAEALVEQTAQALAEGQRDVARKQAQAAIDLLDPLFANRRDDHDVLLALTKARLGAASVAEDDAAARLHESVLTSLEPLVEDNDPRLLVLHVTALLGAHKANEARPLAQRLWKSGYRDAALAAELRKAHVDYPINTEFREKLRQRLGEAESGK